LGLRWIDVDLDGRLLRVERTLQRIKGMGVSIKDTPKTKLSRRSIALPIVTVDALRSHLLEQKKERLGLGGLWNDHGLVFPWMDGSPWSPDALSHRFTDLAKSLGLSVTFHGRRHTHASHMLSENIHPKLASARLGHSSIGITMNLYSHVLPGEQKKVADAIDRSFPCWENVGKTG
jgi:integrase